MLNNTGLPGLLLIVAVTVTMFGRGKVSAIMGEMSSAITVFERGIREGETLDVPAAAEKPAEDGKCASFPRRIARRQKNPRRSGNRFRRPKKQRTLPHWLLATAAMSGLILLGSILSN
ncbi:MAG: twin-arginine translocation protein TatA [Cereibacter sp.]|jgi:sec-independent protein translocase protein TatA|nr:twin-arginine translocation protein TatA [Cereibacter sp.]